MKTTRTLTFILFLLLGIILFIFLRYFSDIFVHFFFGFLESLKNIWDYAPNFLHSADL